MPGNASRIYSNPGRQGAEVGDAVGATSVCISDGQTRQHRAWGQMPRLPTSVVRQGARCAFPVHSLGARHWGSRADVHTA